MLYAGIGLLVVSVVFLPLSGETGLFRELGTLAVVVIPVVLFGMKNGRDRGRSDSPLNRKLLAKLEELEGRRDRDKQISG
jgi:hypothetical protein